MAHFPSATAQTIHTISIYVRRPMDIGMEFAARILQFKCNYASIAIAHCLRCEEDFKWQESVDGKTFIAQTDRHTITSTSIWTNVRDFALWLNRHISFYVFYIKKETKIKLIAFSLKTIIFNTFIQINLMKKREKISNSFAYLS